MSTQQERTENKQDSTRCQNRTGKNFYDSVQCWNRPKGTFTFTRGRSTGTTGNGDNYFRMGFEQDDTTQTCRKCGEKMQREGFGEFVVAG